MKVKDENEWDHMIAEEITECMLDVDCWIVKAGGRICQLSNLPCSDAIRHVSFCQGPEVPEHLGEGGRYGGHRGLWAGGQAQRRHRTAGHTTQHQVGHLITLLYNRWSFTFCLDCHWYAWFGPNILFRFFTWLFSVMSEAKGFFKQYTLYISAVTTCYFNLFICHIFQNMLDCFKKLWKCEKRTIYSIGLAR